MSTTLDESFFNRHNVKLQLATILTVVGFIIFWTFSGARYIFTVESNAKRIDKVEQKLDQLATKADLATLKQDIKDFLK